MTDAQAGPTTSPSADDDAFERRFLAHAGIQLPFAHLADGARERAGGETREGG